MKTGFGLDRFGKATFGWTDFYVPTIVENIPSFYLQDDFGNDSKLKNFLNIFEDIFNDLFYRLDKVDRVGSYLWKSDYISYKIGSIRNNYQKDTHWISIDSSAYNEFKRIEFENGWFFKFADEDDVYMVFRYKEIGFGNESFGLDEFGANSGGAYIYTIPAIKKDVNSGDIINIVRYDIYTYLAKNYGLNLDKYNDDKFRFAALIDDLYRSEHRGHNKGYELSALLYGFLVELKEVYKLFNFLFFEKIDDLNDTDKRIYLFNDVDFKDYYYKDYVKIDGNGYIIQDKDKYYPLVMVFDEFECDPPNSNDSTKAQNYPSLDVFNWMVNTKNPDNYIGGIPNTTNPRTYYDDFSYYTWEYCNRYYSKYAGLILKLTQNNDDIPPELSAFITDRVVRFISEIKSIHIKFLKFVMTLFGSKITESIDAKSYTLYWVTRANMPTARYGAGAAASDGLIYVFGGHNGSFYLETFEVYNPSNNSWNSLDSGYARKDLGVVNFDDYIYAFGGETSEGYTGYCERYSISNVEWESIDWLNVSRCGLAGVVANNKIYAIGGYNSNGYLDVVEEYEPISGIWRTMSSIPIPIAYCSAAVVTEGDHEVIYIFGGKNNSGVLNKVYKFDPTIGSNGYWTEVSTTLPTARYKAMCAVKNGKIYIIGGYNDTNILDVVEIFNPTNLSWTTGLSMPTARYSAAISVVSGRIYVIGGYNGSVLNVNEEFLG